MFPSRKSAFGIAAALGAAVLMSPTQSYGSDDACFIKEGDTWGFYGDSITAAGVYTRAVERVFRHFHPDAKVTFVNNAQGGKMASVATAKEALKGNPNIVSIMLGMNDAINSSWIKGMPVEPVLELYRANITRLVRDFKADGREVVPMTPTLTDESISLTVFRIEGTIPVLKMMAKVCEEVAKAEDVPCIPMQEDFERFQDSLPSREQHLRYDGVHPTSIGQYQIARTLWTRLNFAAPLSTGKRTLCEPKPTLPVEASLAQRLMPQDAKALDFIFSAKTPLDAKLTWSATGAKGSETLQISSQTKWSPKLAESAYPQMDGQASDLVIDLESDGRRSVFFVDIARNALLHMKDGKASGSIDSEAQRPEGARVCDYSFWKEGRILHFEAAVKDTQLASDRATNGWPWGGDAITLYLDLRPTARFAGLGLERDVYQLWFQPQGSPSFSPGFRPWYGKGLENALCPFGEKTADGYKVGFALDGWFNLHERFDVSKMDFISFDMSVIDYDGPSGKSVWHNLRKTQLPTFLYPSSLTVIDLNDKVQGDSLFVANIFP